MKVMQSNDEISNYRRKENRMNKKRMAVGLLLFLILLIGLIVWNQKNRVEHTAVRQSQERQKQETVQKTDCRGFQRNRGEGKGKGRRFPND